MIEQIERFVCGHCGYITESRLEIDQIKKNGICPACQNSEPKKWGSGRKAVWEATK